MALKDSNVLDGVGVNENSEGLELHIMDDMNWDNEGEHISLLEEKLKNYLEFITSGQINDAFPNVEDQVRQKYIVINFEYPITNLAFEFLEFYKLSVSKHSVILGWVEKVKSN